ncbi:MAG: glutamine synthetase adenylyltransferase [Anaerolineae bacterium]
MALVTPLAAPDVSGQFNPADVARLGFTNERAAFVSLDALARHEAFNACWPHLRAALSAAASPDRALVNLERFVRSIAQPAHLFQQLARRPRALEILITLFAGSQFLTEILLRHPEYFEQLRYYRRLTQPKSVAQLLAEIQAALEEARQGGGEEVGKDASPRLLASSSLLDTLRRFQRRELLRIGTCDLLGLADLPTITAQLSYLADSLTQSCLELAAAHTSLEADSFAVIGMGKLGGEELNYSSDIDLLFLTSGEAAAYRHLGQTLIDLLARVTGEGFLYRVDMRLRPWGRDGALVSSLDGYLAYLRRHAGLWEKQALLKARVIAGSQTVGQEFLHRAEPLIFSADHAASARSQVHAFKQRIEAQLRQKGQEWGEVKLGQGSIRDVEFVTQYLQLAYGSEQPDIRSRTTLDALARLSTAGRLSPLEYRVLADGYIFLRTVEHHLQLLDYRQTHALPADPEALRHLARRLGFQGDEAGQHFVERYQQHSAIIRAVYQRYLEYQGVSMTNPDPQAAPPDVTPHLARMDPSYAAIFSDEDIQRHTRLAERLNADNLIEVEAELLHGPYWRVTLVGFDYLGELSLICGLLFGYGFDIVDGHVFTYDSVPNPPTPAPAFRKRFRLPWRSRKAATAAAAGDSRRKIVDVFTVRAVTAQLTPDLWQRYAADLQSLMGRLAAGAQREAQGELAKRVASAVSAVTERPKTLYPIDIDLDNEASPQYTLLRIDAPDTVGFLYELTNALALNRVNISRMTVETVGSQVRDTLYVSDAAGHKITSAGRQRELRVATVLTKHFTHLLPRALNPESALLHFREFLGQLFSRPDWPNELASLERPEVLDHLARLLGVSDFLWNDFLRMQHANLFPVVSNVEALAQSKDKPQLQAELAAALASTPDGQARREAVNALKDREMFRIDMRQIQGHITKFGQFSQELTDLAEVVVEAATQLCEAEVRSEFGQPRLEDGGPCPLSVCGLGKCGGRELGFASDIELMFIYAGNGQTAGSRVITTAEYYNKVVQEVNQAVRARQEGIFELDLRLRPYGKAGSMAVSLDSFRRYFAPHGDAWPYERQALVKLRPIAGDAEFGAEVVKLRDELIYSGEAFDVVAMRAMRERQVRHLVTAGTINAKFSPGALVDVEYLVQGLQIWHGQHHPQLRLTNTREAMAALAAAGFIPAVDYPKLREAHIFLRRLINALRMVRGHAKDLTVPAVESEEFLFLARRLGYTENLTQLQDDLLHYTAYAQELSTRLLG